MKVVIFGDMEHGQMKAIWRCRHELEAVGIELSQIEDCKSDLIVAHSQLARWTDHLGRTDNVPVVVIERIDGAQLTGPVRRNIENPRLRAVVKNAIYSNWTDYNTTSWRGHEFACINALAEAAGKLPIPSESRAMMPEEKWITPEQYAKLHLGFSFTAYPHYDALREVKASDWPETRDVDLHFAGTVEYGPELEWLNWHRRMAVASIVTSHRPAICEDSRTMAFPEYFRTMRNARFVVSPWGLGEPCYRDFEAILCGCMVVKPDTSYIKTVPAEFYRIPQFSRCICKPDFSDLAEVVERCEEISIGDKVHWANWLLQENSTPAIAKRLATIFREAVR